MVLSAFSYLQYTIMRRTHCCAMASAGQVFFYVVNHWQLYILLLCDVHRVKHLPADVHVRIVNYVNSPAGKTEDATK